MSTPESKDPLFIHYRDVLLEGLPDTPLALLLRAEGVTNNRRLWQYITKPGFEKRKYAVKNKEYRPARDGTEVNPFEVPKDKWDELYALPSYINYCQNWHGPIHEVGVFNKTTKTRQDFDNFIAMNSRRDFKTDPIEEDLQFMIDAKALREYKPDHTSRGRSSRSPSPLPSSGSRPTTYKEWSKGKRNPSDFTFKLKRVTEWDEYNRHFEAVAVSHKTVEVLNKDYVPAPGTDEEPIFNDQQDHMYLALVETVVEDSGLNIVKNHQADRDAQKIYAELTEHYSGKASQVTKISADQLWTSFATSTLPKGGTTNTAKSIEKFMGQVDRYNKLVGADERVSDASRLVHLKRFLKNIPDYKLMIKMLERSITRQNP